MNVRVIGAPWALVFVLSVAFCTWSAAAADMAGQSAGKIVSKPVLSTAVTSSGQPIVLPQSGVQLTVTTLEIQPGATLPRHLHPYPRYGYVLSGTLRVTNDETGLTSDFKAGDFIVESIGQWHHAEIVGDVPVKLLVIDQTGDHRDGNTVVAK